jgi:hypothetical protein
LIETDLVYYLLSDSSILSMVGTSASPVVARIYPENVKQGSSFPALTYTRLSSSHNELLEGTTGLSFASFQVSCWATTPKIAAQLADLVRTRMLGIGGVNFQKAGIEDERSEYEPDTQLYRQDIDFTIAFP